MRKIFFYVIAVLLLAAGYPVLRQEFGNGWVYFAVVVGILLITKMLADKYAKK
ncbi:MAG TPA: hypothetical protein VIF12_00395 [Micavibrio sp.]|jgi:hypothetical protein